MSNQPKFFADLHCHPGLYSFNRMRQTELERDPDTFHLWQPLPENTTHLEEARRAGTYAQSDMAKLTVGRCTMTFASITPIEKGFLLPSRATARSFSSEIFKLATGSTALRSGLALLKKDRHTALDESFGILRNDGPLRSAVLRLVLNYDARRIQYMMSDAYDYWESFLLEYDYFLRRDGILSTTFTEATGSVTGRYHMLKSVEDLELLEDPDNTDVLVIMTIEGAHTFTMDEHDVRRPEHDIFARIDHLKQLPSPIFFLTLAHHFDNGLCGHAHSMPDVVSVLADQTDRMHEGIEPEDDLGMRVIRRLLSLDEDFKDTGERRILLDCKHMSARTRKEYYAEVIDPANALRKKKKLAPLPVIFSHASYSGVRSLDIMIRDADKEDDHWKIGGHYAWTLHCSDEDLLKVLETRGLFGICFDQRVAGQSNSQHIHPEQLHHLLFRQILGAVDAAMTHDDLTNKEKLAIWDCICIGSDFDGMIDPINAYPTALSLDDFARDLRRDLEEIKHTRMISKLGVDAIVDKICWQNALRLTKTHLPDALR